MKHFHKTPQTRILGYGSADKISFGKSVRLVFSNALLVQNCSSMLLQVMTKLYILRWDLKLLFMCAVLKQI